MVWWWREDPTTAEFVLKCVTPIGTVSAVIFALFGDYLREKIDPIRVSIEVPDESNTVFDRRDIGGKIFDVYFHHLQVRNMTPHRAIRNCRVWMKRVLVQNVTDEWKEEAKTAVPRLMEWAPSEYSKDKRTFTNQQVFDFGQTISQNVGFELTVYHEQGGNFQQIFQIGKKVRFFFFVTADNYQAEELFCFEVEVPQSVPNQSVTPSKIRAVNV
jgi:hypothetical protein